MKFGMSKNGLKSYGDLIIVWCSFSKILEISNFVSDGGDDNCCGASN